MGIKLIKSIYLDSEGREWIVTKESLQKHRGEYIYWLAECKALNTTLKRDTKKEIKTAIETYKVW